MNLHTSNDIVKTACGIILFIVLAVPCVSHAQDTDNISDTSVNSPFHKTMQAVRVAKGPKLDGVLDDPVWEEAKFQNDFIQRVPDTGADPTEKTEVAIIYDDENVYFGVRLYDSEPDKIHITEMRRDGDIVFDDRFEIVLDTFHDHQSAFNLITNAAGSVNDAIIREDGRIRSGARELVWDAISSIDDKGWYLEIYVPWQTLRYNEGDDLVWGVNFVRTIIRKNEKSIWRFVPLYAGVEGQERISQAGDVTGFNGLVTGGNFDFKPFVTGGMQRDDFVKDELGEIGIDLKKSITSTLTADFTYNTDFAQVEADQEQVNLTRFSLFFPEKRDFFLEGAGTFSFGRARPGGNPINDVTVPQFSQAPNFQLFHSRTIGISDGNLVPILGGTRLDGTIGRYSLGVMSIQTEKTTIANNESTIPETNFSAFRLKRNIFSRSAIGVMFLNKEERHGGFNRSIGFDSNFNINEQFSFFMVGAGTYSPGSKGKRNNFAGNAGLKFQSDLWQYNLSFLNIDKDFNPAMGFVKRTDIKFTEGGITFSPRPKHPAIRQIFVITNANYITDHRNQVLNKKVSGTLSMDFENTTNFSVTIDREFEYLNENFEIRPGLIIPQERYTNTKFRSLFRSDRTKTIHGSLNVNWGDFFTGTSSGAGMSATIRADPKVFASADYNYSKVEIPGGDFHTNLISARLSYAFNTELYIKGFFQWVDDALLLDDRNQVSQNIILRYRYQLGADLYLVYTQENLLGAGNDVTTNRTFLTKLTYLLRK
jgi:hypothetical protein